MLAGAECGSAENTCSPETPVKTWEETTMSENGIIFTVFTKPWRMPLPELGKYVSELGFDGIEFPLRRRVLCARDRPRRDAHAGGQCGQDLQPLASHRILPLSWLSRLSAYCGRGSLQKVVADHISGDCETPIKKR
ncbi:unnamed protein product, partial [marine sediment metagenome]